jgi:putative membrane protein insertion efficiency factor
MKHVLLWSITAYRYLLSPWWGGQCRFTPTCSEFASEAIDQYGAIKGSWLASCRVGRCHPWHAGGFDPVP